MVALDPIFSLQPYLFELNCSDRPTWSQTMHFILNWQSIAHLFDWCYVHFCPVYSACYNSCARYSSSAHEWQYVPIKSISSVTQYQNVITVQCLQSYLVLVDLCHCNGSCKDSFFIFHWLAWYNAWILSLYFFDFLSIFSFISFYFICFLIRRRRSEFFPIKNIFVYIVQLIFSIALRNVWLKSMNPTVGCYYVPLSLSLPVVFYVIPFFCTIQWWIERQVKK